MTAESNVGARLFLIGKDGVLAGLKEITAATAQMNAEIAAGARSSKVAAAGYTEQEAGLARLGAQMDLYQANLVKTSAAQDAVASIGKKAFWGIAAVGAVAMVESIRWASAYQTQLVSLRVQAGLTVGAMNAIGAAAKANSAALGINATQYLQAAYHPASTGMGVKETIAITNNAAKLAAMSGGTATAEDTANALTGVMKSYGFGANKASSTAATLLAIVGAGNMRFGDLNAALSSGVASAASTFGVSLQSLGSALAFATDRGTPAAQAGTRLRMAMSLLGAPSAISTKFLTAAGLSSSATAGKEGAMTSALAASGLSVSDLSLEMRKGGIQGALQMLHTDLTSHGVSAAWQASFLSRAFGGGKMGSAIMQMYDNVPGLQQKVGQIHSNSTQAEYAKKWAATQATLNFQLHAFSSEIHNLGIEFGGTFLPIVAKVLEGLTGTAKWFGRNKEVAFALGGVITAVLAPAIGLYLFQAVSKAGGGIRLLIEGYGGMLRGQTMEQLALERTNAQLATTTASTYRLVAADEALGGASVGGGAGGVAGAGKFATVGGKLIGAATLAGTGWMLGSMVRGNQGATLGKHATLANGLRTVGGDMIEGAGIGAAAGSFIPGVGTLIGGGIGAAAGGIYAEHNQIGSALTHGWDDLFGGGSQGAQAVPRGVIHNYVTVEIDGKSVAVAVAKYNKSVAARN